jgi:hypothetical protein
LKEGFLPTWAKLAVQKKCIWHESKVFLREENERNKIVWKWSLPHRHEEVTEPILKFACTVCFTNNDSLKSEKSEKIESFQTLAWPWSCQNCGTEIRGSDATKSYVFHFDPPKVWMTKKVTINFHPPRSSHESPTISSPRFVTVSCN